MLGLSPSHMRYISLSPPHMRCITSSDMAKWKQCWSTVSWVFYLWRRLTVLFNQSSSGILIVYYMCTSSLIAGTIHSTTDMLAQATLGWSNVLYKGWVMLHRLAPMDMCLTITKPLNMPLINTYMCHDSHEARLTSYDIWLTPIPCDSDYSIRTLLRNAICGLIHWSALIRPLSIDVTW